MAMFTDYRNAGFFDKPGVGDALTTLGMGLMGMAVTPANQRGQLLGPTIMGASSALSAGKNRAIQDQFLGLEMEKARREEQQRAAQDQFGQMYTAHKSGYVGLPDEPRPSADEVQGKFAQAYPSEFAKTYAKTLDGAQEETYGNMPIWGTDAQGNSILMQPSNRGGVKQVQLPPGVTAQRGQTSRVDLGDKFGVLDANGSLIGYMPKGIGPERTVQDDRILTLPAVPGGSSVPSGSSAPQAGIIPPGLPRQPAMPPQDADSVGITDLPPTATETRKESLRKTQQAKYANVVSEDIDRTITMISDASIPVTGIMGAATKNIPGTPGYQVNKLLDTIKANAGFDRLQEMRAASPTGGALGQVSDFENKLLQATIGNLEQAQDKEQLLYNLRRVKDIYLDIIHGPGNRPEPTKDEPSAASGWSIKRVD